jgi:putative chitinase
MPVTAEQLAKLKIDPQWVDALNETFDRFGINTVRQQACFIGQCSHECGNFKVLEENLNYRAVTLAQSWSNRFAVLEPDPEKPGKMRPKKDANKRNIPNDLALSIQGNPKKIANMVYANRMGNRDEASGDGYRFRGRGCIQTTGSSNYFHAGKALGVDFWANPDLVSTPKYAALTAGYYWSTHGLNAFADAMDYTTLTKRINGGTIGLEDRIAHIKQAYAALAE